MNIIPVNSVKSILVIVAHPDDETLWCGGTILTHPSLYWYVISLCRGNDTDRAPKFYQCLKILKAQGAMGELDDGPEQSPLNIESLKEEILSLIPDRDFDMVLTHNPSGEYTRHIRHEEVSRAVLELWYEEKIKASRVWTFAYEDGNKQYFPIPEKKARQYVLNENIWNQKYKLITETYGFLPGGFEAETTPKIEAFWKFTNPKKAFEWLQQGGKLK